MLGPNTFAHWLLSPHPFLLRSPLSLLALTVDHSMDNRPLARRAVTVGIMLLASVQALGFPHAMMGAGALVFLSKLIWDERVVGCCRKEVRSRHDHHHRARRRSGYRPRLSDIVCICFAGLTPLHDGLNRVVRIGPCHAAAATTAKLIAVNPSTSAGNTSILHNTSAPQNLTACPGPLRAK